MVTMLLHASKRPYFGLLQAIALPDKSLPSRSIRRAAGFTLIELLVVLAIVALLLTLAMPRYLQSVEHSKEAVLVENLHISRTAIDKFYGDTGRYPESLAELVDKRYLRGLPYDPVLESADGWNIIPPPQDLKGQVYDLKSTAEGQTRDGKLFRDL
jgi:general secretion pathway protein G